MQELDLINLGRTILIIFTLRIFKGFLKIFDKGIYNLKRFQVNWNILVGLPSGFVGDIFNFSEIRK